MLVQAATDYVRTGKAGAALMAILIAVRKIFTFTQERSNRIVRCIAVTRAYAAGQPVKDIEEKYGCSKNTILRYARSADLPKRPRHLPPEIKEAVLADYKAGVPVASIAALHEVSPAFVSHAARKAGISRYQPRPKRKKK